MNDLKKVKEWKGERKLKNEEKKGGIYVLGQKVNVYEWKKSMKEEKKKMNERKKAIIKILSLDLRVLG